MENFTAKLNIEYDYNLPAEERCLKESPLIALMDILPKSYKDLKCIWKYYNFGDYIRHYPNFCHGKTNGHGNAINLYSGVIA